MVLEKTLESPLDCKEIQPVRPKGESVLGVHWKDWCWSWSSNTLPTWCEELIHLKRPWCWERLSGGEGTTEDEKVGWHQRLNGHGFGWTPGVGDGQGGLMCCSSWGRRVRHNWATELNWTETFLILVELRKINQEVLKGTCPLEEVVKMEDWPKSMNMGFSK